ncbi:cysteinyl leukotriene receptor 2-like [Heterodontus francisci]|uniref:cysteinyl leukotriene receptor 2-like n=1 Tax=Heterodontus francisci TaxID=7792 RepID=UPI00355AEDC6
MSNTTILENSSCENITNFKASIYPPTYIIVFIFGFIENIFCLYVFLKLYKRKTAINIVMVNLAISDLLFVCTLPIRVYYYLNKHIWNLPDSLCSVTSYALYFNMYCSIYFLTLMSILRYFAIVHPIKCLKYRSVKYAQIMCVSIWVFVGVAACPFLKNSTTLNNENEKKCFELNNDTTNNGMENIYIMNLISLVIGCIIPFLVITVCYAFVVKTLLTSKAKNYKQKHSHRKAIAMIVIVMAIFLTSFLPYHVLRTVYLVTKRMEKTSQASCFIQKTVVVTLCGAAINSCLDPLLYYFAAENFRGKLRNTEKCTSRGSPARMHQT